VKPLKFAQVQGVIAVVCSCGKQTDVMWDVVVQKYRPVDPTWKFRGVNAPDGGTKRLGWYCGDPTHDQRTP